MTDREIVVEHRDGAIAVVRINRPHVHNALHAALIAELAATVSERLAADGSTRAIVLTGTGEKAFSAGADLRELDGLDAAGALRVMEAGQAAFRRIEQCRVPVIAAVNGLALGGGFELVLCCSFAVLSASASLGLPEAGLGLIPGYGGTQRLARAVGAATARYVMLTGSRLSADDAYRLGLSPVPPVPGPELLARATGLASEIAARAPAACAAILDLVGAGLDRPLDEGLARETRGAATAIASAEAAEGIAAFQQRRAPRFGASRASGAAQ